MKKIIRLLFAGLFVLLAACYVAGHALLYLNLADGDTAWRSEIEPWLGPQPQKVAYDNDEFGERWLLKADAAWVQRAAQDLHAEPYSLERTIDCREEDYCQGHAVRQRYRTVLPLWFRIEGEMSSDVMEAELWELEDGYVYFCWHTGCDFKQQFENLPLTHYHRELGAMAFERIKSGSVTDLQGNPVLPENVPAKETACVLVPEYKDAEAGAKPVWVPTEVLDAKYATTAPWWQAEWVFRFLPVVVLLGPAVLIDGALLWYHRRMPKSGREYAVWMLYPLVPAPVFFLAASTFVGFNGVPGLFFALFFAAAYIVKQLLISVILLPLGKLFCRMVR